MRYICILVYEYVTLHTRDYFNSPILARELLENKIFCIVLYSIVYCIACLVRTRMIGSYIIYYNQPNH